MTICEHGIYLAIIAAMVIVLAVLLWWYRPDPVMSVSQEAMEAVAERISREVRSAIESMPADVVVVEYLSPESRRRISGETEAAVEDVMERVRELLGEADRAGGERGGEDGDSGEAGRDRAP